MWNWWVAMCASSSWAWFLIGCILPWGGVSLGALVQWCRPVEVSTFQVVLCGGHFHLYPPCCKGCIHQWHLWGRGWASCGNICINPWVYSSRNPWYRLSWILRLALKWCCLVKSWLLEDPLLEFRSYLGSWWNFRPLWVLFNVWPSSLCAHHTRFYHIMWRPLGSPWEFCACWWRQWSLGWWLVAWFPFQMTGSMCCSILGAW